jgi:hypothetical protein
MAATPQAIPMTRLPRKGTFRICRETDNAPSGAVNKAHKTAFGDTMDFTHRLPPADLEMQDCAYNLFRNRQQPEILCAVPEDRPLPGFLRSEHWTYERPLRSRDVRPSGFHARAAYAGVRFNGFYLFQNTVTGRQASAPSELAA